MMYDSSVSRNFSSLTSSDNTSGSPERLTSMVRTCSAIFCDSIVSGQFCTHACAHEVGGNSQGGL